MACWAHARRYFVDVAKASKKLEGWLEDEFDACFLSSELKALFDCFAPMLALLSIAQCNLIIHYNEVCCFRHPCSIGSVLYVYLTWPCEGCAFAGVNSLRLERGAYPRRPYFLLGYQLHHQRC